MKMNSLYILPTITGGGVSSIYKTMQQMQGQERQLLKNKTKAQSQLSINPPKLLPHWHQLPKWQKALEGQYSESYSIRLCITQNMSNGKRTYPKNEYLEEIKLH